MINKDILIKHGILPSLITNSQISEFDDYLQQASEGKTDTFAKFALECLEALHAPHLRLPQIEAQAKNSLLRANNILEKISPSVKESMFSAFAVTRDIKELKAGFFEVTVRLDCEVQTLSKLEAECAVLAKPIDFKMITELKLRKVALCECSSASDLITQYESLVKEAEFLLSEGYAKKVLKSSELIKEASSEILKFTVETLSVISDLESRKCSGSDFDIVIRKYQRIIHDIVLKISKEY